MLVLRLSTLLVLALLLSACDRRSSTAASPPSPLAEVKPEVPEEGPLAGACAVPLEDLPEARGGGERGDVSFLFINYDLLRTQQGMEPRLGVSFSAADFATPLGIPVSEVRAGWVVEVRTSGESRTVGAVTRVAAPDRLRKRLEALAAVEAGDPSSVRLFRSGGDYICLVRDLALRSASATSAAWLAAAALSRIASMGRDPDVRDLAGALEPGTLTWYVTRSVRHSRFEGLSEIPRLSTSATSGTEKIGLMLFQTAEGAAHALLPLRMQLHEEGRGGVVEATGRRVRMAAPLRPPAVISTACPDRDSGRRLAWAASWCPVLEGKVPRIEFCEVSAEAPPTGRAAETLGRIGIPVASVSATCAIEELGEVIVPAAANEAAAWLEAWQRKTPGKPVRIGPFRGHVAKDGSVSGCWLGVFLSALEPRKLLLMLEARASGASVRESPGFLGAAGAVPEGTRTARVLPGFEGPPEVRAPAGVRLTLVTRSQAEELRIYVFESLRDAGAAEPALAQAGGGDSSRLRRMGQSLIWRRPPGD